MLTELETHFSAWIYNVGSKLFTIPFQWKNGILTLKEDQHLFYQVAIWALRLLILGYYGFKLRIVIGKNNVNDSLILGIITIDEVAHAVGKANIWIYKHEYTRLVNQIHQMNSSWGETFLELQLIVSPKREKLFAATILVSISAFIILFSMTILTRNDGYSYYELCQDLHWMAKFFAFLLFLIIQTFSFLEAAIVYMLNITAVYSGCVTMQFWLRKICIDWPKEAPLHETCLTHYKGIYMLTQDFNVAFGSLFIPLLKLASVLGFIVSFFAVIRLHDDLDLVVLLFVAFAVVGCLLFLFPMALVMSSMFDISKQFSRNLDPAIQLVTDKKRRGILMRGLKSCALIRCQVGNLYHMEAKARLTMVDYVINGSLFLLINVEK